MEFLTSFLAYRYEIFFVYFIFDFLFSVLHTLLNQDLFTLYALLWLFTGYEVCFTFSLSFIYWRSGAFFTVVSKSLVFVTFEWVCHVYFDFSYCTSYFHFNRGFWVIEDENICIGLDHLCIVAFFSPFVTTADLIDITLTILVLCNVKINWQLRYLVNIW